MTNIKKYPLEFEKIRDGKGEEIMDNQTWFELRL